MGRTETMAEDPTTETPKVGTSVLCSVLLVLGCSADHPNGDSGLSSTSTSTTGGDSTSVDPQGTRSTSTSGAESSGATADESTGSSGDKGSTSGGPSDLPCGLRTAEEECLDPNIAPGADEQTCVWETAVQYFPSDVCRVSEPRSLCLAMPPGGPGGCTESPCPTTTVLYRSVRDGVEILPGNYCGVLPIGFEYCSWSGQMLVDGPAPCGCACGG